MIDHLHNGVHYSITDERIIEETASVPTTNVSSERDFAVLHRYLRKKPNAQLILLEAIILFAPAFKEKSKGRRQEIEMKQARYGEKN